RVADGLPALANGSRQAPVALLLDRAAKVPGPDGVHLLTRFNAGPAVPLPPAYALRTWKRTQEVTNARLCTAVRGAQAQRQLAACDLPDHRRDRRGDSPLLVAHPRLEGHRVGPARDRPLAAAPARHQPAHPLANSPRNSFAVTIAAGRRRRYRVRRSVAGL